MVGTLVAIIPRFGYPSMGISVPFCVQTAIIGHRRVVLYTCTKVCGVATYFYSYMFITALT